MHPLEVTHITLSLLIFILLVISACYGIYATYYAYFKTKDEREKYIVLRSTANAFTVLLVYYFLQSVVVFANVEWLNWLWVVLHFRIEVFSPIVPMLALFGLFLFIHKRKAGGA